MDISAAHRVGGVWHRHDEHNDEPLGPASRRPADGTASLEQRQEIAREVDSLHLALEPPGRVSQTSAAREQARGGDADGAITSLLAIYTNERAQVVDRAAAALAIADIAYAHDATKTRAELFFVRAQQLYPAVDARPMHLKLLLSQGRSREALEVVRSLLGDNPNNLQLRAQEVELLGDTSDRAGMLTHALALVALARTRGAALADFQLLLARAYFENRRPADAAAVYRLVLATSTNRSQLLSAHFGISEILPAPAFGRGTVESAADRNVPYAAQINALFAQANVAFREARFADVQTIAEQILALDPDDGLAHHMWGDAANSIRFAERPLVAEIATHPLRASLIAQLGARCAAANVHGRPGQIEDLFPEWSELNEEQQAHVALSVLGYGALIPQVLESGAVYHFAGVGTSGAFFDPAIAPENTNAFGRTYYTIRGWQREDFIVTGVERLNGGMRTGSSTVSHEFAHLIHRTLQRAAQVAPGSRTEAQQHQAQIYDRIDVLYRRSMRGQSHFYDAYSSNTPFEFFAQAMQALMTPSGGSARRLFSADPELFALGAQVMHELQTFPDDVALPVHPRIGQDSVPSPLNLQALIDDPATPAEVRELGRATLAHLEVVYALRPAAAASPPASEPTVASYARGADLVRRIGLSDFDGALIVTQDIEADFRAGTLPRAQLVEAIDALGYAASAAARKAHWDFWDYLWSVLSLGIAAIYKHFDRAEARAIRDSASAYAHSPRPSRLSREEHPDLFAQDSIDIANRERAIMSAVGELLAFRAGVLPRVAIQAESIAVMGFSELRALIALDVSYASSEGLVRLSGEINRVMVQVRQRTIQTVDATRELERLRAVYLELRLARTPTS